MAVALAFRAVSAADDKPHTTWSSYLGSPDSNQYSALKQINKSNVKQLEVAWTFAAGTGTLRFDPLVVDGVMYVLGANRSIVALDAASGKEIWTHRNEGAVGDRGMNYWESKDRSERRLLYMNGGFLTSIDARTGNVMASFGDNGKVDVRIGLQRDVTNIRPLQTGNPGRIFENLIIMSLPASGAAYVANPGDTHAYDVRTGELKWVFHSVPDKGEFGADTWPEGFLGAGGGVHNWSELSVDDKRGIVYIPFGTARFDFYGGNRRGNNLFGNSLVALDARTGKRLWHYQIVHHDLWDYDLPQAPKLLTLRKDGRNVDVVAQATKHGYVFVFDRVDRDAVLPDRRAAGPADRCPRRVDVADATLPHRPAALRAADLHREGHQPVPSGSRNRRGFARCSGRRATKACSRRRASRARFRSPATTAAPTGAAPPSIRRRARCTSSARICRRSTS